MRKLVVVIGILVMVCGVAVSTATAAQLSKPAPGAVSEIGSPGSGISASGGGRSVETCSAVLAHEFVFENGDGGALPVVNIVIDDDCANLVGICEDLLCPDAAAQADWMCPGKKNICDGMCTSGDEVLSTVNDSCSVLCFGAAYSGSCSRSSQSDPQ